MKRKINFIHAFSRFIHLSKPLKSYRLLQCCLHNSDTCCLPAFLNPAFIADYPAAEMVDMFFAGSCIGLTQIVIVVVWFMLKNFKDLGDLIHSGVKEIILDSDIVLEKDECSNDEYSFKLDVNGLIIDGNGYTMDGRDKTHGEAQLNSC